LRAKVLSVEADFEVAYDGDGDRIGVVDDGGGIVWGDRLMALFWREILPKYPGMPCIVEVKCSQALVDEINRLGGTPEFYKTGHSLIKARMQETGAVFTGEMSGHMFLADEYYGFDDAFYATTRLARLLCSTRESLSQIIATLPEYFSTAETRIDCPESAKSGAIKRIRDYLAAAEQVITVDGVRVVFDDGWGLVRASNTSPKIVARCEGTSKEALTRICSIMKTAIVEEGGLAPFDWEL